MLRFAAAAGLLWMMTATFAVASSRPGQSRFGETIEVRLLEVEARVVDQDGNPVHGLGVDDFALFEDGKRVELESVYEVRTAREGPTMAGHEAPLPAAIPQQPPATRSRPRTIVFFLDQLPTHAAERKETFAELAEFARTSLREGDSAAIIGWALEARTIVPLTRDRDRIIAALEALGGENESIPSEGSFDARTALVEDLAAALTDDGISQAGGWNFDVEEERRQTRAFCAEETLAEVRRKSAAMKSIVSALTGDRTAAFIYVSNRMPENTMTYCRNLGPRSTGAELGDPQFSTMNVLRQLGRTANAAGVTIYSLRPHVPKTMTNATESGLPGEGTAGMRDSALIGNELSSLGTLADATGGIVGYSPKEIRTALTTIENDLDSYYSLAYRARSNGSDRERRIRVELKDKSLTVRARRSLVERSDLTKAKDDLVGNLYGVTNPGSIKVYARTLGERTKGKRRFVRCEVRFRPEDLVFVERGGRRIASYRVLIVSSDGIGTLSELTEESNELVEPDDLSRPVSIEFELEMRVDGTTTGIAIFDEGSGLAGFKTLDTRVWR